MAKERLAPPVLLGIWALKLEATFVNSGWCGCWAQVAFRYFPFGTFVPRFLVDSCFPELNLVGMVKTKFVTQTDMKIGLIGDEDTVTGMLLAGIGHVDGQGK